MAAVALQHLELSLGWGLLLEAGAGSFRSGCLAVSLQGLSQLRNGPILGCQRSLPVAPGLIRRILHSRSILSTMLLQVTGWHLQEPI